MEELANALFYDSVPESWTRYAYPSLLSLGAWYADLLLRIRVSRFLVKVKAWGGSRYHRRPGITSSSVQWLPGLFFSINFSSLKYLKGLLPREREQKFGRGSHWSIPLFQKNISEPHHNFICLRRKKYFIKSSI